MLRLIQDQPISSVWPAAFQELSQKRGIHMSLLVLQAYLRLLHFHLYLSEEISRRSMRESVNPR